jgi:competence protein ComEA
VAGAVAAVLVVAWTWWQRPQVQPVPATSASTAARVSDAASPAAVRRSPSSAAPTAASAAPLVVSVVGRVHHPGLVTLPPGARVADALAAAGGLLPGADAASVNLAALVTDGQQIAVGVPGAASDAGGRATSSGPNGGGPVNLNSATAADFDGLPGIGPVLAQRIVDYRQQQGPFTSIDQLDDVPGIGPSLFAQLRTRVVL